MEEILDDRRTREGHKFLVKWAYTPQRQWLPLRSMVNCCELLSEYFSKNNKIIPDSVQEFLDQNLSTEEVSSISSSSSNSPINTDRSNPEESSNNDDSDSL